MRDNITDRYLDILSSRVRIATEVCQGSPAHLLLKSWHGVNDLGQDTRRACRLTHNSMTPQSVFEAGAADFSSSKRAANYVRRRADIVTVRVLRLRVAHKLLDNLLNLATGQAIETSVLSQTWQCDCREYEQPDGVANDLRPPKGTRITTFLRG